MNPFSDYTQQVSGGKQNVLISFLHPVHQGVSGGKIIGLATSCLFSGPSNIDMIAKTNGKVVPGPRLRWYIEFYHDKDGKRGNEPCNEFPGDDDGFIGVLKIW